MSKADDYVREHRKYVKYLRINDEKNIEKQLAVLDEIWYSMTDREINKACETLEKQE